MSPRVEAAMPEKAGARAVTSGGPEDGFDGKRPGLRVASFAQHWREQTPAFVGAVHPRLREIAKEATLRPGLAAGRGRPELLALFCRVEAAMP